MRLQFVLDSRSRLAGSVVGSCVCVHTVIRALESHRLAGLAVLVDLAYSYRLPLSDAGAAMYIEQKYV